MANAAHEYSERPAARRELSPLLKEPDCTGGARPWLRRNAGLLCLAIGWALAAGTVAAAGLGAIAEALALFAFGCGSVGFGVGWIVRDERGKR